MEVTEHRMQVLEKRAVGQDHMARQWRVQASRMQARRAQA